MTQCSPAIPFPLLLFIVLEILLNQCIAAFGRIFPSQAPFPPQVSFLFLIINIREGQIWRPCQRRRVSLKNSLLQKDVIGAAGWWLEVLGRRNIKETMEFLSSLRNISAKYLSYHGRLQLLKWGIYGTYRSCFRHVKCLKMC